MRKKKIDAVLLTIPHGEKSKSLKTAEKLLTTMTLLGFTRQDAVITLGGGVVGDLGGFIASVFMRGINYIHVPTTLLAMVDSSIGGKTGVDLATGKNLAGTFHQPKAVLIDQTVLKTLPKDEILNGAAEIIKCGVIADEPLFNLLEKDIKKLLKLEKNITNKIITRCCKLKASIVSKDEKEGNLRKILNYGHTIGHAIELLSKHKISHGRAIAIGMILINQIAYKKNLLSGKSKERINNLIKNTGLVSRSENLKKYNPDKLWEVMQRDKKVKDGKINFIIPTKIGKVRIYDKITKNLL